MDSLVILSEEDNHLLEEFSKLSSDAENILDDMFEVEEKTTETDREANTEEMMDELLGEVIDSIPEQSTDQTKLIEPSNSEPACTKKPFVQQKIQRPSLALSITSLTAQLQHQLQLAPRLMSTLIMISPMTLNSQTLSQLAQKK